MRILGDFANSQILDAALEYDFFTLVHSAKHRSPEAQSMQSKISKFWILPTQRSQRLRGEFSSWSMQ
jgi:hypothetical protein